MAGATLAKSETKPAPIIDDPYLWLEEVEGRLSLEWVEERNRETMAELRSDERYDRFLEQAGKLLMCWQVSTFRYSRGGASNLTKCDRTFPATISVRSIGT